MSRKIVFVLSALGILAGFGAAYFFSIRKPPLAPAFNPVSNPFPKGIYCVGIVESDQQNGANVNIYPEVSGPATELLASEGQVVTRGTPLLRIDDSVQRPTVDQLQAQSEAALATLEQLKAQPRKETLEVSKAQADAADANVRLAQDQYQKKKEAAGMDPGAVSKEDLDTSLNTLKLAQANLEVARKQYELMKAGAWEFDVRTQQHQAEALRNQYLAAAALLSKYVVRAPMDGRILSINVAVGSYVSPQGVYDTYTKGVCPVAVMGTSQATLAVRCYVDEILVHRLPRSSPARAFLRVRGTDLTLPLEYVRTTPYVSPKVELSDQRSERVDVRVLPVIFRFALPKEASLFPGQLVDVYIEDGPSAPGVGTATPVKEGVR
jgi:HlyD family secretion protein